MRHSSSTSRSRLSSAQTSSAAAARAVTIEYQRLLKRTSSTGLTRNVQKPGESMTAVMAAMVPSGTWRALGSCGIEMTTTPPYMPNTELVSPISQTGACARGMIGCRAQPRG